jgi:hypothetical protein
VAAELVLFYFRLADICPCVVTDRDENDKIQTDICGYDMIQVRTVSIFIE